MIRLATFARRVALIGLLHLFCAALPAAAADLASGAAVPPAPTISRDEALAELKRVQAALDRIKQQASAATSYKQLDALDESTQA